MMIAMILVFIVVASYFVIQTIKKYQMVQLAEKQRQYQFGLVLYALLFSFVMIFTITPLYHIVFAVITWVATKLTFISLVASIINVITIVLVNITMFIIYVYTRNIVFKPLVYLWENSKLADLLQDYTCSIFYDHKIDDDLWTLNQFSISLKKALSSIMSIFVILSVAYWVITIIFHRFTFFQYPFYPILAIILLLEITMYISGSQQSDAALTLIEGENDTIDSNYNFVKLRVALVKTFYEKGILFHDQKMKSMESRNDSHAYLQELMTSEIYEEKIVGTYFLGLSKEKGHIDSQYVKATLDIMNRKSILFATPFYKDLTPYLFFALHRSILSKEKVLMIVGRDSIVDDVCKWAQQALDEVAKNPYLWDVGVLDDQGNHVDVGILSMSQLYDLNIHIQNKTFFEQVRHVVLLEPSRIIASAQSALYMLARRLPTGCQYSIFDKNSNGLVDALSHILKTNLTEITATKFGALSNQYMIWEAETKNMHEKIFPSIAKYLGIGSELAVLSLRHGVKKIDWVSYDAFPVVDMKWLLGLYHSQICDYARIPAQQHRISEHLSFVPNIWGTQKCLDACVIVEDEYNNMFEMIRQFSTRGEQQSFVNVISSNYMLRDYMKYHYPIFIEDAKAIPNFTADQVRTTRNVIMELLMMMAISPMSESEIYIQLETINEEIQLDMNMENNESIIEFIKKGIRKFIVDDSSVDLDLLIKENQRRVFNEELMEHVYICEYYINDAVFIQRYLIDFKNAKYIAEDESTPLVLGATLYGLIHQKYLPKQFITLNGKYFEIVSIDKNAGVRLRRASDHIHGRLYYRQLKQFVIQRLNKEVSSIPYRFNGISITTVLNNIEVVTDGYYELDTFNDLAHARLIQLSNIDKRMYKEKRMLKIDFPNLEPSIKVTLAILLNELFKTTYPDNYEYINVACVMNEDAIQECLGIVSPLRGDFDEESLYIIEDSQLDLGMLVSIERNIKKFLEIVSDYITWYLEKELIPVEVTSDGHGEMIEIMPINDPHKQTFLQKIAKLLQGRKMNSLFNEEINENDETVDDKQESEQITSEVKFVEKEHSNYLNFGKEELLSVLDLQATLDLLTNLGFSENSLKQARENVRKIKQEEVNDESVRRCDFCGRIIEEYDDYDILDDSRIRCVSCRSSAVRTLEEFKTIFELTKQNYEALFNVKITSELKLEMLSSQNLHKKLKQQYDPHNGRVLGVAIRAKDGKYTIYIENGAPRNAFIATLVHEITHIWQYENWKDHKIVQMYGKENAIAVYEGMAKWVEIQYLYLIGEHMQAKRSELITYERDDVYGKGFRSFYLKYRFSKTAMISGKTPFENRMQPL